MIIPITFPSAATFWLKHNATINIDKYTPDIRILSDLPFHFDLPSDPSEAAEILYQFQEQFPVAAISPPDKRKFINNAVIKTKRNPMRTPPDAFVKISSQLYVASPEYCFLLAASVLNLEQLILFGNELCGTYIYDDNSEYHQRPRQPVTSAESIRRFLKTSKGCYGYEKALKAAAYILDRSNSFMESVLAVFIRLPLCLGGYALKVPELNKMIRMSKEGNIYMDGRFVFCDIVWEQEKVIVEYDSDISHLSSAQHSKDKQRASALAVSGYQVISITKDKVIDLVELDKTFMMLRKILGMPGMKERLIRYRNKRKNVLVSFRSFHSYDPSTYNLCKQEN